MKQKEYLMGRIVLVDPTIFTDPIQRPGQIGFVVFVNEADKEVITIEFDDGQRKAYRAEYLKTQCPKKMILDSIVFHQEMLIIKGRLKDLLLVYKLVSNNRVQEALKLAMEHEFTRLYCVMDCKNFREVKQEAKAYLGKKLKRKT